MKLLLIFLFLSLGFNFSYGQIKERMMIPCLKEDKKIDSLIDIILKSKPYTNRAKSLKRCLLTGVLIKRDDHSLYFSLQLSNIKYVNRFVNDSKHQGGSLGGFIYKQLDIFLWTPNKFDGLFFNTGSIIVFFDIYKSKRYHIMDSAPKKNIWHYLYKNKQIIKADN